MKGLAMLLAPKKGEEPEEEPEGDDFEDAASDLFDAIKSDDKKAFALALRRVHECAADEE